MFYYMGQCPGCRQWNTLVEERVTRTSEKKSLRGTSAPKVTGIFQVSMEKEDRISSGMPELDRVLAETGFADRGCGPVRFFFPDEGACKRYSDLRSMKESGLPVAFGIKKSAKMFIPKKQRALVW